MAKALLPFTFTRVGRHRMVKLVDPERIDWRHGFFGLGLPGERPIEDVRPFDEWCAEGPVPDSFCRLGGIFHVSRCGSTLLSQNIKATDRAIVLSEPPFLRILRGRIHDSVTPEIALRAVVRALADWLDWARAQGKTLVVKFNSQVHTLREELMAALPGARFVFLHREPTAVFESIMRGPPPYLDRESGQARFTLPPELAACEDDPLLLAAASRYMGALDAFAGVHPDECAQVAYGVLAASFPQICDHLSIPGIAPDAWRADRNAKSFKPDRGDAYVPVGKDRLEEFATTHREVLAVARARYTTYLQSLEAATLDRGQQQ